MGLISSIAKIGIKAFKYGKRALNCAPEFIFGESAHVIGKAYKAAPKGSIFSKAKVAGKAFESHVTKLSAKGGFLSRLWKTTVGLPKALSTSAKAGMRLAGMKGTSKVLGCLKGLGKGIAKKLPYVGALITLAFEAPNIYKGYKKDGIKGALKQCGGAGIELGCMAAGAAIGSCFPGVGTAIGGLIGGLVGWGIRAFVCPEPSDDDEENTDAAAQAQQNQDATETDSSTTSTTSDSTSGTTSGATSGTTSDSATGTTSDSATGTSSTPTTSVTNTLPGMSNPLTAGMGLGNPFGAGFGMGTGFGMSNPFGMGTGFGMSNPFGMYNPTQALVNSLLMPGENIFLKYPMGFQFQYMG